MRSLKLKYSLLIVLLALVSCSRGPEKREYQIMPDMAQSYAHEAQEELVDADGNYTGKSVMRLPVTGTIPRGFEPYLASTLAEAAELVNPLKPSMEVLKKGRLSFNINCTPCHGQFGAGDGAVITKATYNQRMPKPPELYTEKLTNWKDGQLFHVMQVGQGNMPSYANRIDKETRWAIVHYIRALQKAKAGLVSLN